MYMFAKEKHGIYFLRNTRVYKTKGFPITPLVFMTKSCFESFFNIVASTGSRLKPKNRAKLKLTEQSYEFNRGYLSWIMQI